MNHLTPTLPRLSLLGLALVLAFPARAQGTSQQLDTVVVTGQRASLQSALEKQREAQGVVSIVHADGIGQLPDSNAAEALARLPGVTLERDQGEGRFVRVRGMGSDYNNVTINGATVPASEKGRRAPGLDVVPAGLIRSLEVNKTLTPDVDANSIGGSVSVNTLTAFDVTGRLLVLEGGANHDANLGKTRPRASLTYADRFADGKLGLALSLSGDERRFASDNVETGGAWDDGKLEEFELRRYSILRQRVGAAMSVDWRPAAGQELYLRGFSSRFTDEEERQSIKVTLDDAQAPGVVGSGLASRGLKSRREVAKTSSLTLGGKLTVDTWEARAEAGAGRAEESTPNALASSAFDAKFASGLGYTDSERPALKAPATLADASLYKLNNLKIEDSDARDRVGHLKFDLKRGFELAGGDGLELKAGAKSTRRHKDNQQETWKLKGKTIGTPAFSAIASGDAVDYPWGSFGLAADSAKARKLWEGVDLKGSRDAADSVTGDFDMKENLDAAYAQATWDHGGLQVLGGLRMERITFKARGMALVDDAARPIAVDTRSTHWLPALLARQDLGSQLLLRAAVTSSLVRPTFEQLSPGKIVDGDEAELGNPGLKPLRSRNLDLGLERGLGRDGTLSAYVFHKRIKDFVFQTDLAGSPGWESYSQVNTFANGDSARLRGAELAYAQALRSLPAPFNGLIVGANATFVHSKARVGGYDGGTWKSRDISLPSQSDRSFNLSLGWEGSGVSTRLAMNRQSSYLIEVGDVFDAAHDLRVDGQKQLDFSFKIAPRRGLEFSFEAANLTNNPYYVYQSVRAQNAQYERYGRTFKLGVKWSLS